MVPQAELSYASVVAAGKADLLCRGSWPSSFWRAAKRRSFGYGWHPRYKVVSSKTWDPVWRTITVHRTAHKTDPAPRSFLVVWWSWESRLAVVAVVVHFVVVKNIAPDSWVMRISLQAGASSLGLPYHRQTVTHPPRRVSSIPRWTHPSSTSLAPTYPSLPNWLLSCASHCIASVLLSGLQEQLSFSEQVWEGSVWHAHRAACLTGLGWWCVNQIREWNLRSILDREINLCIWVNYGWTFLAAANMLAGAETDAHLSLKYTFNQ